MSFNFEFDDFEIKSSGMDGYFDGDGEEVDLRELSADSTRRVRAKMEGREVTATGDRSSERRINAAAEEVPDRMKVASIRDLDAFVRVSDGVFVRRKTSNGLVRESEKDLWTLNETDDGLVIERMFDDNGDPIKA